MQSINIVIEGYWRDQNKRGLPAYPGIFFVYQTKYKAESDMVSLINVIYVGEADNIRERIATHPLYPAWIGYLNEGEELCFSWAYVDGAFKTMVKAAFIFKLKPAANTDYKNDFPFEAIKVLATGRTGLLETEFSVGG